MDYHTVVAFAEQYVPLVAAVTGGPSNDRRVASRPIVTRVVEQAIIATMSAIAVLYIQQRDQEHESQSIKKELAMIRESVESLRPVSISVGKIEVQMLDINRRLDRLEQLSDRRKQ